MSTQRVARTAGPGKQRPRGSTSSRTGGGWRGDLAAVEITSRSVGIARVVVPASIAEGPLDAVERHLGRRQGEAHKSEKENRDNVAEAAESVLNRVVVGVVDMLDMEQLIDHVPINKVVARVDLPGVIDEIDLAGVIREASAGLGKRRDTRREPYRAHGHGFVECPSGRQGPPAQGNRGPGGPLEWHCSTGECETGGRLVSRRPEAVRERGQQLQGLWQQFRRGERDRRRPRSLRLCRRWSDRREHRMGFVLFEFDLGCGSPALVERTVGVDPSRRVPDSRLVH